MNMDSLKNLKAARTTNLKKLQERAKAQQSGGSQRDERLYRPKLDEKNGNTVILRFLPPKVGTIPLVEIKTHSFTNPDIGISFYQKSRQNLLDEDGNPQIDPVNEACKNAYRKRKITGDAKWGDIGRKFLPRSRFYANALVIKDELQPEREGEVVIFDFGPQIHTIIQESITPAFSDIEPIDPFDLWGGSDFYIRMKPKEIPDNKPKNRGKLVTVPDYEKSSFGNPREVGTDEEKMALWDKTHNLDELVSEDKHKSFDELAKLFKRAWGLDWNWLDPDYTDAVVEQVEHPMKSAEPVSTPSQDAQESPAAKPWADEEPEETGSDNMAELSPREKLKRMTNKQ